MGDKKDTITGIIGLFSGHPNPELSLTGRTVEQFSKLIKTTIGKEPIHPPPPPRLGSYYGFRVHIPPEIAKRAKLPAELNVYHGVVTVRKKREQEHWRDVKGVEQFLIKQAQKEGYGTILEKTGATRPK